MATINRENRIDALTGLKLSDFHPRMYVGTGRFLHKQSGSSTYCEVWSYTDPEGHKYLMGIDHDATAQMVIEVGWPSPAYP